MRHFASQLFAVCLFLESAADAQIASPPRVDGTPAAMAVVDSLAGGPPIARLTREAAATLKRLSER